jgi:hypothetical protein
MARDLRSFGPVEGLTSLTSAFGHQFFVKILPVGLIVPFLFLGIGIFTLWFSGRRKMSPTAVLLVCLLAVGLLVGLWNPGIHRGGGQALDMIVKALTAAAQNLRRLPF